MSDRDCNRCLYATRDGGCASWDCNFISIAEAEPKRGRWIVAEDIGDCCYRCSNCGFIRDAYVLDIGKYCPNCGARMTERDE